MKEKFIKNKKDSKRKDNLIKALEKYKRFKSLGKLDFKDSNSNSFTIWNEQNIKRLKSIERIYRLNNNYNIIFEDENENSDNEIVIMLIMIILII